MATATEILGTIHHVVVQDYPRQAIPDALTRAGLKVTIYGGPDEADVIASELVDGVVVTRKVGHRPDSADLLYVYRPLDEIEAILADAHRLGVSTIWRQPPADGDDPDADGWRNRVEAAGLTFIDGPDIDQVAQDLSADR